MEHYDYLQVKNRIASENYGVFGISVKIEYSELIAKTLELTLKSFRCEVVICISLIVKFLIAWYQSSE
jgi:hypothetical protein